MSGRLDDMRHDLAVLVLGVGGNVSQGILKALALSRWRCRVIGACTSPLAAGLYTVDRAYLSPPCDHPDFAGWLARVCRDERVDAVLSGVEPVLAVLADLAPRLQQETGAVTVVSPPAVLAVGADKLTTCRWLAQHGFPVPRFAASDDRRSVAELVAACGYPLIAKPRRGRGMHGVFVVDDAADLAYAARRREYLLQEYLADGDAEFTAGCFSDRDGRVRGTIVLRRELLQGTTYRAEAGLFPEVRAAAAAIADALRPLGPCNAQFRVDRGQAVCFEINVRFSGTTPLRARFGFNEVEAALRHYVLGEPAVDLPLVTEGLATRYWNEVYVDPAAHAELAARGALENPGRYGSYQESYGPRPRSAEASGAQQRSRATP